MRAKHCKKAKQPLLIVLLSLVVLAIAVGGVSAFLISKTEPLENVFTPAKVTCEVEESFSGGVKQNVSVKNTGDVAAYIRAAVVATFVSENGKVLATAPTEGTDYIVEWGNGNWQKGSDGFWYYKLAVSPENSTDYLIKSVVSVDAPAGYNLNLQIVATAIQSDPANAVEEAWGVAIENGEISFN